MFDLDAARLMRPIAARTNDIPARDEKKQESSLTLHQGSWCKV